MERTLPKLQRYPAAFAHFSRSTSKCEGCYEEQSTRASGAASQQPRDSNQKCGCPRTKLRRRGGGRELGMSVSLPAIRFLATCCKQAWSSTNNPVAPDRGSAHLSWHY